MSKNNGFTIIEVVASVTILAILLTVTMSVPTYVLPSSRDTERVNDMASIARQLEQAYSSQTVGQPAYPTTTKLLADISSGSGTVAGFKDDALKAPNQTSSSVVAATSNSTSSPKGAGSPVLNQYVYQPLDSSNALCTGTATCVRFFLYYRLERTSQIVVLKSIHQQ